MAIITRQAKKGISITFNEITSTESQPNLHHPAGEIDVTEPNLDDREGIDFSDESSQVWDIDFGSTTNQLSGISQSEGWAESIVFKGITSTESQPTLHHPAGEIDVTEPNLDDRLNDSKGIDFRGELSQLWDVDSISMTSHFSGIDQSEGWEECCIFKKITSADESAKSSPSCP